ncbi:hypothetical protein [Niabella aquatica]
MTFTTEIRDELALINSSAFKLGEYIYMGMGKLNGRTVCISTAYKIDYCMKKALQFTEEDANVVFDHINKVRIGQLEPCQRFSLL